METHDGNLVGHFGRNKTLAIINDKFYSSKMEKDVMRLVKKCNICHMAKNHPQNAGLYTLLLVPKPFAKMLAWIS